MVNSSIAAGFPFGSMCLPFVAPSVKRSPTWLRSAVARTFPLGHQSMPAGSRRYFAATSSANTKLRNMNVPIAFWSLVTILSFM